MKYVLFLCLFLIYHSSYAIERQVGLYVESIDLDDGAAEELGIGKNLRTVGMSVSIRKPWLEDLAF